MFTFFLCALLPSYVSAWGSPNADVKKWNPDHGKLSDFKFCVAQDEGHCDCHGVLAFGRGYSDLQGYRFGYWSIDKPVYCAYWGIDRDNNPAPDNGDKDCHCATLTCDSHFNAEIDQLKGPEGALRCVSDKQISEVNGHWVVKASYNYDNEITYTKSVTSSTGKVLKQEESSSYSLEVGATFSVGGEIWGGSFGGSVTATATQGMSMSRESSSMLSTAETWTEKMNCPALDGTTQYVWQYQLRSKMASGGYGPNMNTAHVRCVPWPQVPRCTPFFCKDKYCVECTEGSNGEKIDRLKLPNFFSARGFNEKKMESASPTFSVRVLFVALFVIFLMAGVFTFWMKSKAFVDEEHAPLVEDVVAA